ncbi:MAG: gliding motility-associated C-terminal domain-containing protein [Flavobacteriales bacterium]|nr:gliding motility-associated C-terminal domain-containing protein [Flavobacteriales bacterium]
MMKKLYKIIFAISVFCLISTSSNASHLAGGDFSWECLGNNQYVITLNLFRDCDGINAPGSAFVNFSSPCGTQSSTLTLINPGGTEVSQLCPQDSLNSTCHSGGTLPGMQQYIYVDTITLIPCPQGPWTMSYEDCCRNSAIVNLQPATQSMTINADLFNNNDTCNNSPTFTAQPIPYVCQNQPVSYNYGVTEPDGDSLSFSLVCAEANGVCVTYAAGYTAGVPIPGITIDPATGQLNFTPTLLGNFVVVVQATEVDPITGDTIGIVKRDIQFIVIQCSNIVPDVNAGTLDTVVGGVQTGPYALDICNGDTLSFCMTYTDPDIGDSLNITTNVTSILPGASYVLSGSNPLTMCVTWPVPLGWNNPNTNFTVTVDDGACPIKGLQSFVYDINVTGAFAGPDQIICGPTSQWPGQAFLQAFGGSQYQWSVISGDPIVVPTNFTCDTCDTTTATPSITTTYLVTTNLGASCNSDSVTVFVVPDYSYTTAQSDTQICLLDSVAFNVVPSPLGNYTIQWFPASIFDNDTIFNPIAGFSTSGINQVWFDIISPQGCLKSDTFDVSVLTVAVPILSLTGDSTLCEGDSTELCLTVLNGGAFQENFDPGIDTTLWTFTNGVANINCSSVNGNALWFNSAAGVSREAETIDLNTSAGGTIDFYLLIADGSVGTQCENADFGEDVVLEYSTDGGITWTIISTYNEAGYPNFTLISEPIPPLAQTNATRFKWRQLSHSGTNTDNWALDSIVFQGIGGGNWVYDWDPNYNINPIDSNKVIVWPATDTSYTVVVTDSTGQCTDSATFFMSVVPTFNINITQNDTFICLYDSINFNVSTDTVANPTIIWTPGVFNNDSIASPTGGWPTSDTHWVYVEVTNQFGCTQYDSSWVYNTPNAQPDLSIIGDTTLCAGDSTLLCAINSAVSGDSCTYVFELYDSWGDGWNGASLEFYINGTLAGTYTFFTGTFFTDSISVFHGDSVHIVMTSGTFPGEESFVINGPSGDSVYFDGPNPANGPVWGEIAICTIAGGQLAYTWSPNYNGTFGDTSKVWVYPAVDTTYQAVVWDSIGGCADSATIDIYVVPNFNVSITQNDTIVCLFDSVEFTVNHDTINNPIIIWQPGPIFDDSTAVTATAGFTCPDTAWVEVSVSSQFGCTKYDSAYAIISSVPKPDLFVAGPTSICDGDTANLCALDTTSASGCANINDDFEGGGINLALWLNNNGIIDPSCGTPNGSNVLYMNSAAPRTAETYDLNMNFSGASLTYWFKLAGNGSPNPCEDADLVTENVLLEYSTDGGATWTVLQDFATGAANVWANWVLMTTPVPVAAQTTATRFRWQQTNNSGIGFDNWALDDVTITSTSGAPGGYVYNWSPNFNLSQPDSACTDAWPVATTTYTVTAIDSFAGCGDTATITVNVLPQPNVNILSTNTSFCQNDSNSTFVATPTPGTWIGNGISSGGVFDPSAAGPGNHQIVYNHNNGACDGWDTVLVSVNPNPAPPNPFANNPYCEGEELSGISVTGSGGSFEWYNDAGLTDQVNDPNDETANGQTFYVIEISANGCASDANTLQIVTVPVPEADISSNWDPNNNQAPITIDFDNETSPINGNNYEWFLNGSSETTDVEFSYLFTESGIYSIVLEAVEQTVGCSDTATVVIEIRKFWIDSIPNVFTPNGDGFNDEFVIDGEGLTDFSMVIYNRWGRKIYECGPTADWRSCAWDGDTKSDGVYYYVIQASDDKGVPVTNRTDFQGYIQLIRD